MLNELKTLADSIRSAGFSGEDWDDDFKPIKVTSPCFVISLSTQGEITDIRFLDRDRATILRTWQGGSLGATFPAFNFQPFYKLTKKLKPAEEKEAFAALVQSVRTSEAPPASVGLIQLQDRSKADAKTAKCLGEVSREFFDVTVGTDMQDAPLVRLRAAMTKFLPEENVAVTFNRKLFAFLQMHLADFEGKDQSSLWPILYAQKADAVLFFDLAEPGDFPIASKRAMQIINERLLAAKAVSASRRTAMETDAFGFRASAEEIDEKLPEVKLPGALANTKLRSMNAESKCQARYGRIDAESFPVGTQVRKATKAALTWISSSEREGKTWAIAGANELVFAYPKNMPPTPPLLARLFGNGRSSADADKVKEARFEQYAAEALSGMKTLAATAAPNAEIEVFAIKKADKARRKVVFYRNYSIAKLESAVATWLAGADNIPPILIRKWPPKEKGQKAAKGTKPVPCEFRAPLPLAAMGLVYTMWSQDCNEKFEPKFRSSFLYEDFPVFDGLELFLSESVVTGLAERMLSLLLQGSGNICVASGNLSHKHAVIENKKAIPHLETALPLFGILLHKLNRTKEKYMENAPYLIGRFLNLADGLHAVWCRNVRDWQLPPQLLGSSLFASFQLNPVQGFANAGIRMKPYLDWAKTNQSSDVALSRWFVGEFGRVTAAIEKAGIPARLSDADKAEMLLGYLSASGKTAELDPPDAGISNIQTSV